MKKQRTLTITILFVLLIIDVLFYKQLQYEIDNDYYTSDYKRIPYSGYDYSLINKDDLYSYEDRKYDSLAGIDVSSYQGDIDWYKVKQDGIDFAMIRIGYRGSLTGILHVDRKFERNYKSAIENNIKVGIYFYSQAANIKEAADEARFVIKVLDNKHLDLPIVYDYEETYFENGVYSRIHELGVSERTNNAPTFLNIINNSQYDSMLYTNLEWADYYYNLDLLDNQLIWFAQYNRKPQFEKPFVIWQYTNEGTIDGIEGYVDLNLMFIQKNDQN